MKFILPIFIWAMPLIALSQVRDSLQRAKAPNGQVASVSKPDQYKPEIFTSGFIDILNSGQVNASARFVRLFIGEPGKFAIPLSLYSGVSSNNFQNRQPIGVRNNDELVTNFINPLSGLANVSVDGVLFFTRDQQKITRIGMLYHVGERVLTGMRIGPATNPSTGKPHNFFNSFVASGFYLQTGAWERSNTKNIGLSWLALRYIWCYTTPGQLKEMMPDIVTNGIYNGYSIAWGVEISKLVNIRVVYYKYLKKPEIDYSLPIYQFSFNYSMK